MAAGTNTGMVNINSDLGESFGPWVMGNDTEVLKIVRSANVACGFHGVGLICPVNVEPSAKVVT